MIPQSPKRYKPPCKRRTSRRSAAGKENHRLYDRRAWRRASAAHLAKNPFCVDCEEQDGILRAAVATDHIIPHKGDEQLFWDTTNWASRCAYHHGVKSARE